ncbi:glycoside hydrolase family 13 protein [Sanguibacter hominis ATCC BAA-789]|uniref:Glycoside hydrolase family 13 protein n=1 Tax=Sanguibacter hominis ATCC BAA-789 TaxID=1312740 RepID=A0A9X5IS98_9MICO|nr:glycoside hydrolase family 13 protein [Sanguibacter hominis]NKX93889.1 glycoside hydrolase family 13 protein [Sanguibacter hominis ATCC BAA-789]
MTQLHHLPHHDGSELYSPDHTDHRRGATVRVRVRIPHEFGAVPSVVLRTVIDGEPRFQQMERGPWSPPHDDGATWWTGRLALENDVTTYRFLVNRADGTAVWLNGEGVDHLEPVDSQDFRATVHPAAPAWAREQVLYQIFPDRFARSTHADARTSPAWALPASWDDEVIHTGPDTPRQLFGGDLDGIVDHLDHLERLGVTLVYLTPFFPGGSNHRYDATTFDHVDPLLGGDEALVRLVQAAHARGIRVIGDLTTNHTGDTHEWFVAAHRNPGAVESDFYYWKDPDQEDYIAWSDVPSLPKLDWTSTELRRRFIEGPTSVVARWLQPPFNLDGWRIDVANMTGRLGDTDLNSEVQRLVRQTMDAVAPGSVLYAESTNDAAHDFAGDGWQGPMSYAAFTRPLWHWLRQPEHGVHHHFGIPYEIEPRYSGTDFVATYRRFTAAYPWPVRSVAMNAIDTHDTPRFAERADDDLQVVAAGLSLALPGTPTIFAGDEFGITGVNGEDSRAPLPWGEEPRLAEAYRTLVALRRSSTALQQGSLRWLHASDDAVALVRETQEETVVVVAARSATTVTVPLAAVGDALSLVTVLGDAETQTDDATLLVRTTGPAFIALGTSGPLVPPALEAAHAGA